ncbi:MAG TPA: hypothetical protein VLQ48_09145 [Chloroflexia bacterium]|nr:hypothetical protein [Chloroflexia bacterium]
MLGEIFKVVLRFLWAIVRAVILEAVVNFLWAAILTAIVYPIGAIGQASRAMFGPRRESYEVRSTGRVRRQALLGVFVLLVLWAGSYLLFGPRATFIISGITLSIVVLGWFDKVAVPGVD